MDGFRFDLNLCTGCQACELACRIENGFDQARGWRRVYTFNDSRLPGLPLYHLSLACNHCAVAPCLKQCPALAIRRDGRTGAVLVEQHRCLGCSYCSWACPFDAPCCLDDSGVMTKCTFCNRRLLAGSTPACVTACPTDALGFGRIERDDATLPAGFPATAYRPAIRFMPLRSRASGPERSEPPSAAELEGISRPGLSERRIGLGTEWPLVVFTLAASLVVALSAASLLGRTQLPPLLLAALTFASMAIGSAHLGRKERAWRAVLNLRRSWLSREIALFGAFGACLLLESLPMAQVFWGWLVLLVGFGALFTIDRVYDVAQKAVPTEFHSAGVLLTGTFLTGLFLGHPVVLPLAGAVKLALYLGRQSVLTRSGARVSRLLSGARVVVGLVLPALLWWGWGDAGLPVVAPIVLIGESIDRAEYYLELDIQSPSRELRLARETALAAETQKP